MKGLKQLFKKHGVPVRGAARDIGLPESTLRQVLKGGAWPARMKPAERQEHEAALRDELSLWGASAAELKSVFSPAKEKPAARLAPRAGRVPSTQSPEKEGQEMLLRKQLLTADAKKAFGVFSNPWNGEVTTDDEMFLTPDMRYVREAMWHAARNSGLMAVIGESGAGKTTIKEALLDRIEREGKPIITIAPSVLGLEDNDVKGKSLKAGSIADAIIWSIDPRAKPNGSMEAKTRDMQRRLEESQKAGFSHVVIIEEAHCLALPTLKHLKRFHELKAGRKRLLSIILIGQPELRSKLSETNPEVREFVQRCEIATLDPLDKHLADYLAFRAKRVERALDDFIEPAAIEALRGRLCVGRPGDKGYRSLLYPLAVNNMMTAAMNAAAELGAPKINADVVRAL